MALAFLGMDPTAEGWDNDGLRYADACGDLIASTDLYTGDTKSVFLSGKFGYSGETFKALVIG